MLLNIIAIVLLFYPSISRSKVIQICKKTVQQAITCISSFLEPKSTRTHNTTVHETYTPIQTGSLYPHKSIFPNGITYSLPLSFSYFGPKVSISQFDTQTSASTQSSDDVNPEKSSHATAQTESQLQVLKVQHNHQLLEQKLRDQEKQLGDFADQLVRITELLQTQQQVNRQITQQLDNVQDQHIQELQLLRQQIMLTQPSVSTIKEDFTTLPHVDTPQQNINNFESLEEFPQQQTLPQSVPSVDHPVSVIRFHHLKVLASQENKFDGDPSRYQRFKEKFNVLMDTRELTDLEKALVLYLSLEDDVITSLGDITTDSQLDYQKLWRELDDEYLLPVNGLYSHFAALSSISSWDVCNTHSSLDKLRKFLRFHCIALERLGAKDQAEGYVLQVLSKLSGNTADRVSTAMINSGGKPVLPQILEILREEVNIIGLQEFATTAHGEIPGESDETLQQSTVHIDPEEYKSSTQPVFSNTNPSGLQGSNSAFPDKVFSCIICESNSHTTHSCRRYSSPGDYRRLCFQNYWCYNCLGVGHRSHGCLKNKVCTFCDDPRKHSPLLCRNYHE